MKKQIKLQVEELLLSDERQSNIKSILNQRRLEKVEMDLICSGFIVDDGRSNFSSVKKAGRPTTDKQIRL